MRGRRAKAYHWYSKETALAQTFSCKNKEQKSTRHGRQGLIYKISFFIFTSIFAILLAFRQAYTEFVEQLDSEKSRTSGTPRQFHQGRARQESKTDIQAADAQSSLDQENVIPHQSAKQETVRRLPSREQVKRQLQLQQQKQQQQGQQGQQSQQLNQQKQNQNQNQNVLPRETKPTVGQNGQTRQDLVAVNDEDSVCSQRDPLGVKK